MQTAVRCRFNKFATWNWITLTVREEWESSKTCTGDLLIELSGYLNGAWWVKSTGNYAVEKKGSAEVGNTWLDPSSFQSDAWFVHDLHKVFSNLCAAAFVFNGSILCLFGVEGCAKLKCYPSVFTTVHAHVLSRLCAHNVWVPMCLGVHSVKGGEREGGWKGRWGVSCSIWSLTCCGALLRPPCLEVSSAGIGRLHASSIRGSILLLPCRLLSWELLNWA